MNTVSEICKGWFGDRKYSVVVIYSGSLTAPVSGPTFYPTARVWLIVRLSAFIIFLHEYAQWPSQNLVFDITASVVVIVLKTSQLGQSKHKDQTLIHCPIALVFSQQIYTA